MARRVRPIQAGKRPDRFRDRAVKEPLETGPVPGTGLAFSSYPPPNGFRRDGKGEWILKAQVGWAVLADVR